MTARAGVREPYAEAAQQREAATMGMYIFLATELMLFGGLFTAALADRILHPAEFVAASKRLHVFLAAANTAVLLTSSLTMALAADAARRAERHRSSRFLALTALLGLAFLGLKAAEYGLEAGEGLLPGFRPAADGGKAGEALFMNLYLVATGLHAIHLAVAILLVAGLALRIWIGTLDLSRRSIPVELVGLFWHLVDVVWVFLYPVLYLAR